MAETDDFVHEPGAATWLKPQDRQTIEVGRRASRLQTVAPQTTRKGLIQSRAAAQVSSRIESTLDKHGAAIRLDTGFAIRCL
jgi:hypothetical protein